MQNTDKQNFSNACDIDLPNGGSMNIQMTDELIERIKKRFKLDKSAMVSDKHVVKFFFDACDDAITNSENK